MRFLLMLLLLSSKAFGVGFGKIELFSNMNESLKAEIEVLSSDRFNVEQLQVQLAPAGEFSNLSIDRPLFLEELNFELVRGLDRTVVMVTSDSLVKQPYVEFLLELIWPDGRIVKSFTLLLDPISLEEKKQQKKLTLSEMIEKQSNTKESTKIELTDRLKELKKKQEEKRLKVQAEIEKKIKEGKIDVIKGQDFKLEKSVEQKIKDGELKVITSSDFKPEGSSRGTSTGSSTSNKVPSPQVVSPSKIPAPQTVSPSKIPAPLSPQSSVGSEGVSVVSQSDKIDATSNLSEISNDKKKIISVSDFKEVKDFSLSDAIENIKDKVLLSYLNFSDEKIKKLRRSDFGSFSPQDLSFLPFDFTNKLSVSVQQFIKQQVEKLSFVDDGFNLGDLSSALRNESFERVDPQLELFETEEVIVSRPKSDPKEALTNLAETMKDHSSEINTSLIEAPVVKPKPKISDYDDTNISTPKSGVFLKVIFVLWLLIVICYVVYKKYGHMLRINSSRNEFVDDEIDNPSLRMSRPIIKNPNNDNIPLDSFDEPDEYDYEVKPSKKKKNDKEDDEEDIIEVGLPPEIESDLIEDKESLEMKLDLASQYLESDDIQSAKDVLEEIMAETSDLEIQSKAQDMLDKLEPEQKV